MTILTNYLQTPSVASSITTSGPMNLITDGVDSNSVISGAFISMVCLSGFVNVGGPLNITCNAGTWSQFPNCVTNTGGGTTSSNLPTTTASPGNTGARCPYTPTLFNIANGFLTDTANLILFPDSSTATGDILIFTRSFVYQLCFLRICTIRMSTRFYH
jgi:hypothetical protein